jgi:hypothetical protein
MKSTDMHNMADCLGFNLKKSIEFCAEDIKAFFESSIALGDPVDPDVLQLILLLLSLSMDKKVSIFSFCSVEK